MGTAKVHYHTILANVDWLHGLAESNLTITNLLIGECIVQSNSRGVTDGLAQIWNPNSVANCSFFFARFLPPFVTGIVLQLLDCDRPSGRLKLHLGCNQSRRRLRKKQRKKALFDRRWLQCTILYGPATSCSLRSPPVGCISKWMHVLQAMQC